jgi:hypothetical protein
MFDGLVVTELRKHIEYLQQENAALRQALVALTDAKVAAQVAAQTALLERAKSAPANPPPNGEPQRMEVDWMNPLQRMRTEVKPHPNLRTSDQTPTSLEESFKMREEP